MEKFIARAAQAAYNQAGYSEYESQLQAQAVAEYVQANLIDCQKLFGIEDELEIAYRLALMLIAKDMQATA